MRLGSFLISATVFTGIALLALPPQLFSQEPASGLTAVVTDNFPEAPTPQSAVASVETSDRQAQDRQTQPDQNQSTQQPAPNATPAQNPASQGSSSSQTPAPQTDAEKSQHDKAEEQLKQQEKQRVMGVMATFNTTSNKDALPLSPGQKFQLFFRSETDPWPFLLAGVVSGIGQADGSNPEWGGGIQGYAKRYGAAYSDAFIGNFLGNAVLPSVLHEDPRYYQKGSGKFINRALWAAASTVWCKRDNGSWGPNYANIVGNLIGSAISDAYYPASDRTVGDTVQDGFTVSAEGIVGSEVIEFWPDIARHYKRKHAEKLARQSAQGDAQSAGQPASQSAPAAPAKNPQN